ncbi:hypothetical protein ASD66_10325 [Nocardioides sp. Root151]|nr:hypothetical protein ASD66_10325 [Nocardioides sp. Root151]
MPDLTVPTPVSPDSPDGAATSSVDRAETVRSSADTVAPSVQADQDDRTDVPQRQPGVLSSRGTTKVLAGVLAVLLLVGLGEVVTWAVARGDSGDSGSSAAVLDFGEPYTVTKEPVKVPMADWRDATDSAVKSVTEILNVSWKDYDQNLDDASKYITDRFAKEYAATTKDTRDLFLKSKAEYDFAVVGASVVEAQPDEVASLLFLNQFVYKGEGKQRTGPEIYPVRVMVRMVRTDSGWKIDELHAL